MAQDWKDMLASLKGDGQADEAPIATEENAAGDGTAPQAPQSLRVLLDKKGRKGKTATIVEGFTLDDEAVADIASELKRKIGTGGSSRGGEILLQGDWRDKAATLLRAKGFTVKLL